VSSLGLPDSHLKGVHIESRLFLLVIAEPLILYLTGVRLRADALGHRATGPGSRQMLSHRRPARLKVLQNLAKKTAGRSESSERADVERKS